MITRFEAFCQISAETPRNLEYPKSVRFAVAEQSIPSQIFVR